MNEIYISMPIRINFGGAWSDTPPFCYNEGGCVCNCSAKLNGIRPIRIIAKKIKENKIIIQNEDDVKEYNSLKELKQANDKFLLQRTCIGVSKINNLGFKIITNTEMIPKGSGLGTSSILSLGILTALGKLFNLSIKRNELINKVLEVEKLIGTGGGWQDQAGAICSGIKIITSKPGEKQKLNIEKIKIRPEIKQELNKRILLIYTGNTRNSSNIVFEVMKKYKEDNAQKNNIIELKKIAVKMKNALELGDIDEFASYLNLNYNISQKLSKNIVNDTMNQIFNICEEKIKGKMICGAGNGGFVIVLLKDSIEKKEINDNLIKVFPKSDIRVWEVNLE